MADGTTFTPTLETDIRDTMRRAGRPVADAEIQRMVNVIRAFPKHWPDWRPDRAWDDTGDLLSRYREFRVPSAELAPAPAEADFR